MCAESHVEHLAKHVVKHKEKWAEILGCEISCDTDLAGATIVLKEKKSLKIFAENCYKSKVSAHRCWQWAQV